VDKRGVVKSYPAVHNGNFDFFLCHHFPLFLPNIRRFRIRVELGLHVEKFRIVPIPRQ
jgi:hypothetical protein